MTRRRRMSRTCGKLTYAHKCESYKRDRHRLRESPSIVTRSQAAQADISLLLRVPQEVFHLILDQLSVRDISVLCMASKEITCYVVEYISTVAWRNKSIIRSSHPSSTIQQRAILGHYRDLGLLFKRCTLLLPTKERLRFIFTRFSQIPCFRLEQCDIPECRGFTCYGAFLQTLIAGWDELECHRVFNFLCELTNLLHKIEAVILAKPGVKYYQEIQLRQFCRHVLLNPWLDQSEGQFWLMLLLNPWPLFNQARILFILYGPLLPEGVLAWQDVVVRVLPHNSMIELAKAIIVLFSKMEVKGWSSDSMLAIFEELIVIPEQWHIENVARLLVLCGSGLSYTILASKALNGRFHEIARLIVFIILVCQKDGYQITWAVKLVQAIWTAINMPVERLNFIQQLENMFSEVTKEFYEQSAAGNQVENRESFQSFCILLEAGARFHTKFLQVLLK